MYNPYNYHIAVRDDALFFGREAMLRRLLDGLSAPTPLSAAIFGGRRSGKTSLLSKLRRVLGAGACAAGERRFIPCSLDLQRGRPLESSDDFFLWVLEELGEAWEQRRGLEYGLVVDQLQTQYRNTISRGPVDAFVCAFRTLDTQGERIRLAILIDESEGILTVDWSDDLRPNLRYLLSNSPIAEDVALVMAGSTQMYTKVTEHDSPLENILDHYLLPALDREATLALARQPNGERLSEDTAEEVWRQSGGQACMAQYILHELWADFEGELEAATVEDVGYAAQDFDQRTQHFSTWIRTLGSVGWMIYLFLLDQNAPVAYGMLRTQFAKMPLDALKSTLDALVYHGLVHCHGRGRGQHYSLAGTMYRDWFLAAGQLNTPEQTEARTTPVGIQVLIERIEQHIGAQTNIAGGVTGPVASGKFESAAAVGGGEAVDQHEAQGPLYKPQDTVEQNFDTKGRQRK